jgi:hypothetical protein
VDEIVRELKGMTSSPSDHRNNPADGSNWENLCGYCHEDEHSRELLGEYLHGDKEPDRQR